MIEKVKINHQKKMLFLYKVNLFKYSKDSNKGHKMKSVLTQLLKLKIVLEDQEYLLRPL